MVTWTPNSPETSSIAVCIDFDAQATRYLDWGKFLVEVGELCNELPAHFLERISAFPAGYRDGTYLGRRYGVTLSRGTPGATKLYAEELGGNNYISFNLYHPTGKRALLKPCEMPVEKVIAFVMGVELNSELTD
jgi:hypothetical protein